MVDEFSVGGWATAAVLAAALCGPALAEAQCPVSGSTYLDIVNEAGARYPETVGDGFDLRLELVFARGGRTVDPPRLRSLPGTRGVWFDSISVASVAVPEGEPSLSPVAASEACGFSLGEEADLSALIEGGADPSIALPGTIGSPEHAIVCCTWSLQGYATRGDAAALLGLDGIAEMQREDEVLGKADTRRAVYQAYGCSSAKSASGLGWGLVFLALGLCLLASRRRAAGLGLLLIFSFVPSPARAAPTTEAVPTLVFTGLRAGPQVEAKIVRPLERAIEAELSALNFYRVASRAQIAEALSVEEQKVLLGCRDDSDCMVELAGALDSSRHLYGTLDRLGSTWLLSLTLIDTSVQRQIGSRQLRLADPPEEPGAPPGFEAEPDPGVLFTELPSLIQALARDDGRGAGGLVGLRVPVLAALPVEPAPPKKEVGNLFYLGIGFLFDYASLRTAAGAPPVPGLVLGGYGGRFGGSLELTYVYTRGGGGRAFDPVAEPYDVSGAVGFTPLVARLSGRVRFGPSNGWLALAFGPSLAYPYLGLQGAALAVMHWKHLEFEWRILGIEGYPGAWVLLSDAGERLLWQEAMQSTAVTMGFTIRYGLRFGD